MIEALVDSLVDSVRMLPLLFGAYLIIEYLEHHSGDRLARILRGSGKFGPAGGAFLGVLPQCGFSVAAANFYSGGIITRGTLLAVFLSTSDEAIPVLLAAKDRSSLVFSLIAGKVVVAFVFGFLIDWIDAVRGKSRHIVSVGEHSDLCDHCHCGDESILKAAFHHALRVFLFIVIVSVLLNGIFYVLGEENVALLLMNNSPIQPFITGLFGFIPNCAASVILAELLISGSISYGAAFAGLCTGAGFGLAILLKTNHSMKDNAKVVFLLYIIGVGSGLLLDFLM